MAVPTSIIDLSQTAASNSPSGSDTISGTLDDHLRAGYAIEAQEAQNKGWTPQTSVPTYISVSTFSVTTDQTTTYYAGRPIRCTITGAVRTGIVVISAYSSVTTVTVILDGDLDNTLSRIDLGMEPRPIHGIQNPLVNPWFRFWQRNTTFSLGAGTNAKVADGFAIQAGASGVVSCTRQAHTIGQSVVPFEPTYFLRWDQTTGGTDPNLKQHIESVRTFAGTVVTVWFIAKCSASTVSVTPRVIQSFGSGGSSDVVTAGTAQTVTTTFKLFKSTIAVPSISGKTIGTLETDSLRVDLLGPSSTIFTLDVAAIGINRGSTAYVAPPLPFGEELARCRRRYFKTFAPDVVPAQNSGISAGAILYTAIEAGANAHWVCYPLTVPLRIETTSGNITFYSPSAVSSAWYNHSAGAASGASTIGSVGGADFTSARDNIVIENAQAAGDGVGDGIAIHCAIDADFTAA